MLVDTRRRSAVRFGWTLLLGFFLGGLFVHAGDPGLGILLVPVGAALLFAAVWLAWRAAR